MGIPQDCAWPLLLLAMSSSCWKSFSHIGLMITLVTALITLADRVPHFSSREHFYLGSLFVLHILHYLIIFFSLKGYWNFIVHLPINLLVHPPTIHQKFNDHPLYQAYLMPRTGREWRSAQLTALPFSPISFLCGWHWVDAWCSERPTLLFS